MIKDTGSSALKAASFGSWLLSGLNTRLSKFDNRPRARRGSGDSLAGNNTFAASVLSNCCFRNVMDLSKSPGPSDWGSNSPSELIVWMYPSISRIDRKEHTRDERTKEKGNLPETLRWAKCPAFKEKMTDAG